MPTDRHMKLSDVEAATDYAIPRVATTFEKAYPEVKTLQFEIEGSDIWGRYKIDHRGTEKNFRQLINCANPHCYGGGVNLDRLLRWSLIERKQTSFEETISCCGYEGSPKGRRKTGSCDTSFRVKIAVEYTC